MRLIILYGPPASGKLTTALALKERIGCRVLHNHLTIDLLKNVLDFGTPTFYATNQEIKLKILKAAVEVGTHDVVYTFSYAKGKDDYFVQRLKEIIDQHEHDDVQALFVQLVCSQDELRRRVGAASRKQIGKLNTEESLVRYLGEIDVVSTIEGVDSLVIDNTNLTADEVVEEIVRKLKLS